MTSHRREDASTKSTIIYGTASFRTFFLISPSICKKNARVEDTTAKKYSVRDQ
jgi:hypothetical protein